MLKGQCTQYIHPPNKKEHRGGNKYLFLSYPRVEQAV